jgi:hypothetical protein
MVRSVFAAILASGILYGGTSFRDDRVPLNGAWKFQLRHDNQLLTSGPVRFGPVSASSQAAFIEPWRGSQTSAGRWRTAVPWALSATLVGSDAGGNATSQLWKPHADQTGPVWWSADLGTAQRVAAVRIHWAKAGPVAVAAEVSGDGTHWTPWPATARPGNEPDTWLEGPVVECQHVKLTFTPSHFDGTRLIEVFVRDRQDELAAWKPRIQRTWYEDARKYTAADNWMAPGYADAGWADIRVPGYWEVQKFSAPTWWQPDDTVGYYRRTFSVPERWRGRHVRLRFEGVNNGAQIWINGRELEYHESGFTAFEREATPLLKFGEENSIAVRVSKWTLTHEYDTDDMWFLGGIWRDAYLYSLPSQRIEDYTLQTQLDPQYKDAVLRAKLSLASSDAAKVSRFEVEGELFDSTGQRVAVDGWRASGVQTGGAPLAIELAGRVTNPRKWTAETPNLYALVLRLRAGGQTVHEFRTSIGFRQVEVRGESLLVNGVPVKLHGIVTTRANPEVPGENKAAVLARELRLLKESNINAIRSHTTPLEDEFLDLCDQHGIYVIPDVPYVWVNEWDFRYLTEGAVLRAREVYAQLKNRPSVILWHVGNENGPSPSDRGMGRAAAWLHANDLTRPVTVCMNQADTAESGTTVSDWHYAPMKYEPFLHPTGTPLMLGEFHAPPEELDRLRDLGFVETWGRSLKREWAELEKRPWVAAGMICCWDDGSVNGDMGPRQWGIADSKRNAKPMAYHVRKVFSPVKLQLQQPKLENGALHATLLVTNRYTFSNLDGFVFRWELRGSGRTLAHGGSVYRVKPGAAQSFPLALAAPAGANVLRVTVHDRDGYSIESEDFAVTKDGGARSAKELISGLGLTTGEGKARGFRTAWQPGSGFAVQDAKGAVSISIPGLVLERGKSRKENVPLGVIEYGEAQRSAGAITVPFHVKDAGATVATGRLLFESGANWIQAKYELLPAKELVIREIGLGVQFAPLASPLIFDRAALWSAAPEGWHAGPHEQASLKDLAQTGSQRNLYWLAFHSGAMQLLAAPIAETMNLRFGATDHTVVLSDFLNSGDFLGKSDLETIERKLPPGKLQTAGLKLYALQPKQWDKLEGRTPGNK